MKNNDNLNEKMMCQILREESIPTQPSTAKQSLYQNPNIPIKRVDKSLSLPKPAVE
jgi:hypothetical protein